MRYILLIAFMLLGAYLEQFICENEVLREQMASKQRIINTLQFEYIETREHVFPYVWPIHKDDYTQLTSPFGIRTIPDAIYTGGATERVHEGLDLTGTWHARVLSIEEGEVIDKWYVPTRWREGHPIFGGYIRIQHENGVISGYGHLSEIYVREGDQILQGQVIARIGNTGLSAGEHLHLSILNAEGEFLNPLLYIKP